MPYEGDPAQSVTLALPRGLVEDARVHGRAQGLTLAGLVRELLTTEIMQANGARASRKPRPRP
jgi:hypothetical protein